MHFQSTDGCDNNNCIRHKACHAAFDVEKFFCSEVGAEACLRNGIVTHFKSQLRCHYRITAVSNVGKGAAVNKCGRSFECLNKIRLDCILQKGSHRTLRVEITCGYGLVIIGVTDDNF